MAVDFSEFDKKINLDELREGLKEASENDEYKEVPHGEYEVSIEKLELTQSKKGDPMISAWFKILEGEYKNSRLFMNQVITQPFQIKIVNKFLESLESGVEIDFETYSQYGQMIMDVAEAIDKKLEYSIEYGEKKGFNTFKITEVFEV